MSSLRSNFTAITYLIGFTKKVKILRFFSVFAKSCEYTTMIALPDMTHSIYMINLNPINDFTLMAKFTLLTHITSINEPFHPNNLFYFNENVISMAQFNPNVMCRPNYPFHQIWIILSVNCCRKRCLGLFLIMSCIVVQRSSIPHRDCF